MNTNPNELPSGWRIVPLGDLTSPSAEKVEPEDFGDAIYLGLEHIEGGSNRIIGNGDSDAVKSTKSAFRAGDVLYGKLRPYLNKVCRPDFDGVCSTDILVYPQVQELDNGYLVQLLSSTPTTNFATQNASGINLPRVSGNALLEQFRQSLLAAAFRGDLTADWRAANPNVEPASELLNRIRQERRQKWEQSELAKYEAKGKVPTKNWQDNYEDPEPVDESELPELPYSWCWARSEEVCAYITKGTTPPQERMTQDDGEVRFLKVGNLSFTGTLDFSKENTYIDNETHNAGVYMRSRVYPGETAQQKTSKPRKATKHTKNVSTAK